MTKQEFVREFAKLAAGYDKSFGPETMSVYYEHLRLFDQETFAFVCRRAIGSSDWFPSVASLVQACRSRDESRRIPVSSEPRPQLEAGPPPTVPREVLEFCANAGMDWARKRLQEAA